MLVSLSLRIASNMDISNKQNRLRTVLNIACVMAFAYGPGAMAANCKFLNTSGSNNTSTPLNCGTSLTADSLAIPPRCPINTVIYEESLQHEELFFTCTASFHYGMVMTPALGVPSGNTDPLGKTGRSFRIKAPNPNVPEKTPPPSPVTVNYPAKHHLPTGAGLVEMIKAIKSGKHRAFRDVDESKATIG